MESKHKFWLGVIGIVALFGAVLVVYLNLNAMNTHNNINEAILHGSDPIAVACAHDQMSYSQINCALVAAKK